MILWWKELIPLNSDFRYIDENLRAIRFNMSEAAAKYRKPEEKIRLMAVTKTVPPEAVNHSIELGIDLLGENRVQEYQSKKELYRKGTEVQFIGHLQTNKVKYIIDSVSMIQSVDSIRLASEINRLAKAQNIVMDVLCEVNIGGEESKSGVSPHELEGFVEQLAEMEHIHVRGLMTIPPPSDSCFYFEKMQRLFEDLKAAPPKNSEITLLSMGMSADYTDAVKFGTGMVRLGSALFGARNYSV